MKLFRTGTHFICWLCAINVSAVIALIVTDGMLNSWAAFFFGMVISLASCVADLIVARREGSPRQ